MKRYLISVRQNDGYVFYHVRGADRGQAAAKLYEWLKSEGMVTMPRVQRIYELRDTAEPQRVAYVVTMDMEDVIEQMTGMKGEGNALG